MPEYRWNQSELAAGYDAAAALVHTHYVAVQDAILESLLLESESDGLIVDLGGGSGRLVERILSRWPRVRAVIIDQSQAFLELAGARLERFGQRATLVCRRLQEDWRESVPQPAAVVVSMSAIHHLDPSEKQTCYRRCHDVLQPGGILLNGDEVRSESEADYRRQVEDWAAHMERLIAANQVTPAMADGLRQWRRRNLDEFDLPKISGDDCHETAAAQRDYLRAAGFDDVAAVWSQDIWTVLKGRRPS